MAQYKKEEQIIMETKQQHWEEPCYYTDDSSTLHKSVSVQMGNGCEGD